LFNDLACSTCHLSNGTGRGPTLSGIFGKSVELESGTATVDEGYVRESIVNPQAKIVAGYQPIMPTFQGLVTEEQLLQLIAYVKSLSQPGGTPPPGAAAPAPQGAQPEIKK
jgi:cytochrome c oxidase subunit 2